MYLESLNRLIDLLEEKCLSMIEGSNIVDPIVGKEIKAHYAKSHIAGALLLNDKKKEKASLLINALYNE